MHIGERAFRYCRSLYYINYLGTKEQWENIPKGEEWNAYTPMNIIRCVDGDIKL